MVYSSNGVLARHHSLEPAAHLQLQPPYSFAIFSLASTDEITLNIDRLVTVTTFLSVCNETAESQVIDYPFNYNIILSSCYRFIMRHGISLKTRAVCKETIRNLVALMLAITLLGCGSAPVFETDPSEFTVHGIVESKKAKRDLEEHEKALAAANNDQLTRSANAVLHSGATTLADGAVGGALFVLFDEQFGDGPILPGETYIYLVQAEDGVYYKVESKFSGFKVGECVKLFVSHDLEKYPVRMTLGFECKETT
jgi:hypothetical protein